jgi:putative flavoprotein involved in K+ transport
MFQFPNWSIRLPGHSYACDDPDGFVSKDEIARFLEDYARLIQAPLRCGVRVTQVQQDAHHHRFLVETGDEVLEANNVVIAVGSYHEPLIPPCHKELPADILQLHSRDYRNPQLLPPGAVLIVGSGASGAQIAEDLHEAGRRVYLSVGRHSRTLRRYRGRDIYWWLGVLKFYDRPVEQFPEIKHERAPVMTGAGSGRDIDFRRFAADGITLLGRLRDISGGRMTFADDLEQSLRQGEAWFAGFRERMDEYAHAHKLHLPEPPPEPAPVFAPVSEAAITELDIGGAGIAAVIWATGFRYNFDWIKLPVFGNAGEPLQRRGVSPCPGFYFIGLRAMYTFRSSILEGVADDASYITEHIQNHAKGYGGSSLSGKGTQVRR